MVIMQVYFPRKNFLGKNYFKFKFCGKMDLPSPQTYKLCYIQFFFLLFKNMKNELISKSVFFF